MIRKHVVALTIGLVVMVLAACDSEAGTPSGDIQPTSESTETAAPSELDRTDFEAFQNALMDVISDPQRDYDYLQTFMGDPFEILVWYGSAESGSPEEAMAALRVAFLIEGTQVTFSPDEDLTALLGGNPEDFYPSDAAGVLFSEGWGEGNDEVLLIFGQNPDGTYFWQGMLVAYNGFDAPPPTEVPDEGWHVPSGILCADLQADLAAVLGVAEATLEGEIPFTDHIEQTSGTGCRVSVMGTGADFGNYVDVYLSLSAMLEEGGWVSDEAYVAGGPNALTGGFRRGDVLLLVFVGWEPSDDANCPTDQPLSACELTPAQQLFAIGLAASERHR